jgi:hypothetical protein
MNPNCHHRISLQASSPTRRYCPIIEPGRDQEADMIRDIRVFPETRRLEMKFMGGVSIQDRLDTLALVAPLVADQKLNRILVNFSAAWHEPPLEKGGVSQADTSAVALRSSAGPMDMSPRRMTQLVPLGSSSVASPGATLPRSGSTVHSLQAALTQPSAVSSG